MNIFSTNNPGFDINPFTDAEIELVQDLAGLGDPNADRILFWDDSAGAFAYLTVGSGLSISGTTLSSTATGTVDTANSPATGEFARFTDADTIEGRTAAETRADLDLEIGTDVLAYDAGVQQIADLADPNADRLLFWDDSAGAYAYLTLGTGLSITDTTLNVTGASLADGDYGDITASSSGTVLTIDNDVVTYAKMQNVSATSRILGRITANAGDVEELTAANVFTILGITADATELNYVDGVTSAIQTQLDGKQPLDADLTAIAALTTTAYGRGLLELADETALEALLDTLPNLTSIQGRTVTLADAGANAIFGWDDTAGAYENLTQAEARTVLGLASAAYVATDLADLNEATIEAAIDTLANLTSIQGRTVTLADAGADALLGWDDSAGAYENMTQAEVLAIIGDSSDTAKGVVELATAAETTTGTDAARAVTPDGLAGSDFGKRVASIQVVAGATDVATGDGKAYIVIPDGVGGMNLIGCHAYVVTAGTTNTTDVQIHNVTQAADMLTTKITIDSTETSSRTAAAAPVIDGANDDVADGDILRVDVDAVSTTAPKGLIIELVFQLP